MNSYKFTKNGNNRSFMQEYENDMDAQNFADNYDGGGWYWEKLGTIPQISSIERVRLDKDFGKLLNETFLADNKSFMVQDPLAPNGERHINTDESLALLQKFQVVNGLLKEGDIISVLKFLNQPPYEIATDSIYTEARKQKYIQMVQEYLNSI